jgi:hypothetical protein
MAVDVSPLSPAGEPLFGQWDNVRTVRSFLAPSTIMFGTAVVWVYGRKRIGFRVLHIRSVRASGSRITRLPAERIAADLSTFPSGGGKMDAALQRVV